MIRDQITIKQIVDEDFVNYKKPSMFIAFPRCSWKCERECGLRVCQNGSLATLPDMSVNINLLLQRYINNPITQAFVLGGLEPMDSPRDIYSLIQTIRRECSDDIVIYTGYTENEASVIIQSLFQEFSNILIKYGRYIPGQIPHYDPILGVHLASDNQYGVKLKSKSVL
jgi:hypothetical protein